MDRVSAEESEHGASNHSAKVTTVITAVEPPAEGVRRHGSENRRAQNRNAAARHRQRQQQRLGEWTRREAILKQRVSELEVEVEVLRRGRAGLRLPERDPFTATILEMLGDVNSLRASLVQYASESQLLVDDRVVGNRPSHTGQQRHQHKHDSVSPSMSEGDDAELDDEEEGEEDVDIEEGDDVDYRFGKRNRQWTDRPISADGVVEASGDVGHVGYSDARVAGARSVTTADLAGPGGSSNAIGRAQSPRSARRLRNRLAAARMRTRQKQQLVQLEKRKSDLERRAKELETELLTIQQKNNPLNSSIDKLAEMIDDLTKVEFTMLTGIDECKGLLQNLEQLYESRKQQQN
ncbi:hypothetical protein GGI20_001606 [Coemansia sp. BCRC 34301]|nr:hypothetical protein GGI20_001606 [Coemansia sp. BCRC 34301]